MTASDDYYLKKIESELRRVASLPPMGGGSGLASSEYYLERIYEIVAGWSPGSGVDPVTQNGTAQTVRLLGPFTVNYNTPGIGGSEDGALLTELTGPLLVMQVGIVVTTAFDGDTPPPALTVYLGGPDYGAPDDDFAPVAPGVDPNEQKSSSGGYVTGNAALMESLPIGGGTYKWSPTFGVLDGAGALVAQLSGGVNLTQGVAKIYAWISENV